MKALTFQGIRTVEWQSVRDPGLEAPTDAILKIELAAICGSDLHPYHGRETGIESGTVMGHEAIGEILEVGSGVRRFQRGDRVLVPFTSNCGSCFYCRAGLTCRCAEGHLFGWREKGTGLHGLQAEMARIPLADATLLKIPRNAQAEEALLLCDIFPTGYYAAVLGEVRPNGCYVVVGCGPVGLMAVRSCFLRGAETVFVVDDIPSRLDFAERLGAKPLNFRQTDVVAVVKQATEGRGADSVLEMVGAPSAQRTALDLLRPGGTLVSIGVHTEPQFCFSPIEAYNKNLIFKTGRCPARYYAEELLPTLNLPSEIAAVFTHQMNLSQGAEAYRIFDEKREGCIKVALRV